MKKELIINATSAETRIALLEEGVLVNLFVEFPENERNVGDIYKATVRRVMPGMQAAFLDIGWEIDGFIHFSDLYQSAVELAEGTDVEDVVQPEKRKGQRRSYKPRPELKVGQEIIVQVIKEPIGTKGPRLSSQISLPGRFLVLMPGDNLVGVSKRIPDVKERRRLKGILKSIRPEGFGLISRTIGEGKSEEQVRHDLRALNRLWGMIDSKIEKSKAPARVHKEAPLTSSIIRDLFAADIDRIVVDDKKLYREIRAYVRSVATPLLDRVHYHSAPGPIFDTYKIESEIDKGLSRKVWFGGGSYLIIEHTEAVVTIDVNSGRYVGKEGQEENSLRVNLKAAKEIARQIRLRDLGGIIIIDFIDQYEEKNRRKIHEAMRQALKTDRAKWDLAPISQFGIMEMTRQRTKLSLIQAFNEPCPTCNGSGMVMSKETIVTRLQSWVRRFRARTGEMGLTIRAHPEVVEFITKGLKSHLRKIMWDALMYIKLEPDDELKLDEFRCYSWKQKKDVTDEYRVTSS
ncbi:Rne/Rng family ribonuclease [bacterium]|nr:Rne/Rng family ribonuclease [bacterium]MBU1636217.1 Rne/Rng family ribonuclease [bacterium]MBU1920965.1 Rne/Rng family ribonuclease [bacterium]